VPGSSGVSLSRTTFSEVRFLVQLASQYLFLHVRRYPFIVSALCHRREQAKSNATAFNQPGGDHLPNKEGSARHGRE
jgi:hypothetical protein